jgi:hypothetical protein
MHIDKGVIQMFQGIELRLRTPFFIKEPRPKDEATLAQWSASPFNSLLM